MSVEDLLVRAPGLRITDPRRTSVEVHAYLRELIISGTLPPGVELKQAELARLFAVSRTPLREAFRMLQEEGLVSAEPNQRSHVLGLNPDELELLYAGRVALECLGVRLTAGRMTRDEARSAIAALWEMDRGYRAGDMPGWSVAHHRLHRLLLGRVGDVVLRTIASYAERSERYVRSYQLDHWETVPDRHQEHRDIFEAVRDGVPDRAVALMATHLARTAVGVMRKIDPTRSSSAIDAAVALVAQTDARADRMSE